MIPPTAPPPRRALPWVAALLVLLFPPAGLLVAGLGPAAAALPLSVVVCGIAVYAFAPLAPSLAAWALLLLGAAFVGMYVVAVVVAFRHGRRAPVRSRRERIWLLLYAVVLCAGWYAGAEVIRRLRTSRTEPFSVSSNSMRPTLLPGDQVLVDRRSVSAHRRGEVVVFRREGQNYLKRVVGLPGEMVEVRGHEVFVDGKALDHTPCAGGSGSLDARCAIEQLPDAAPVTLAWDAVAREGSPPIRLDPDSYFLLGDERDNSYDSRHHGPVRADAILGRVMVRWFFWSGHGLPSHVGQPID